MTAFVIRGRPGANDRPPLPAGHQATGHALARSAYPHPVFRNSASDQVAAVLAKLDDAPVSRETLRAARDGFAHVRRRVRA